MGSSSSGRIPSKSEFVVIGIGEGANQVAESYLITLAILDGSVFFPNPGNGPPAGLQIDNGVITDDETQQDADAPDAGPSHGFRLLIEDFDTVAKTGHIGDATIVDTTDPRHGHGFPTQRTVVVTAKPGLYNYICSIHPWMQGQIRVTSSNGGGERDQKSARRERVAKWSA
jgi:hypothetical protein